MTSPSLLTVVLAAGKGTRMKSAVPKVLHKVAGLSMLGHVMKLAEAAGGSRIAVVIGPGMDAVRVEVSRLAADAQVFIQPDQRGTADAVLAAREALAQHAGDVLVLYADTPLITAPTLSRLRSALDAGAQLGILGFHAADPTGYGRLLTEPSGALIAIREEKDATHEERRITLCNSGVMAFRVPNILALLDRISNTNAKGEFYLTDAVALAREDGLRIAAVTCEEEEVLGINSRDQLAHAESIWQQRARLALMREGVTMIAPETVWLSYDTCVGRDVVIEPNVFLGPGVVIEEGAEIKANCHFEGARIGAAARVGPFARLRVGSDIGRSVHIGNFVEVKNSTIGPGAKANHLAYLGDGRIGPKANIGAGTIFCNYDGFNKSVTEIGEGAFIGSNASLVAPVRLGAGSYVGSGSVITKDVPAGALAIERSSQDIREGWADKFRRLMSRKTVPKATAGGEQKDAET